MFNIGIPELVVILGIAILVVGPKRLPELAKSLGKGLREFRKATDGVKETFRLEDDDNKNRLPPVTNGNEQRNPKPIES